MLGRIANSNSNITNDRAFYAVYSPAVHCSNKITLACSLWTVGFNKRRIELLNILNFRKRIVVRKKNHHMHESEHPKIIFDCVIASNFLDCHST